MGRVMSMAPDRTRPDGQLLHVDARARVEHGALLGHGDHRQGPAAAEGGRGGAVDRVDGDVGLGRGAVPDPLPVVEHGGVVLLALADDDHPVHGDAGEHDPHGVDRRPVGPLLVAPTHPPGRGQRRRLGDPDQLHGQVAVGCLRCEVTEHDDSGWAAAATSEGWASPDPEPGRAVRATPIAPIRRGRAPSPHGGHVRTVPSTGPRGSRGPYWRGGSVRRDAQRTAVGDRPGRWGQELGARS